ncbi:MAG: hypothetical protein ACKO2G_07310 [Verrucomicrobiales bacterium]
MIASPATQGIPPLPGPVVCPSCRRQSPVLEKSCPHCGYTGAACVAKFPFAAPRLEPVLDAASLLEEKTRESITRAIAGLQGEFPQLGVWVCLVNLDAKIQPAEFGFWMMNACPVEVSEDAIRRLHGALLLVDTLNDRLALTLGYRLEQLLAPKSLDHDLDSFADIWPTSPEQALLNWLTALRKRLLEAWNPRSHGNY